MCKNIGGPRYIVHVAACFRLVSPLDSPRKKGAWWSWPILRILAMAKKENNYDFVQNVDLFTLKLKTSWLFTYLNILMHVLAHFMSNLIVLFNNFLAQHFHTWNQDNQHLNSMKQNSSRQIQFVGIHMFYILSFHDSVVWNLTNCSRFGLCRPLFPAIRSGFLSLFLQ